MEELKETTVSKEAAQPQNTQPEKPKTEKVKQPRKPMNRGKRVAIYCAVIVVVLILTNPTVIPFMPEFITKPMQEFMYSIFGNMNGVAEMVKLDWSALFQLVIMAVIMLLVRELCKFLLEKYNPKTPRANTMKNLVASALKYILAFVAAFWALSIIGVNVSTLFASVGVMALIIGFGAESLIADVITGLFMIFENQYNVGDIIELDGYRGTVVNIAIRTTSIEDSGGNIKIFNNSDVRNIVNLSADSSRAVCDIPIPYEADIDAAEKVVAKLCTELTKEHPEVFKKLPECVGVQALGDSAVVLRVVAHVDEVNRFAAARIINKKMKTGLEKAGMGAPYAQIVVHKGE